MFKRYECGCIGVVIATGQVYRIKDCRGDQILAIQRHDALQSRACRDLHPDELIHVLDELQELVQDGHALQNLRAATAIAKLR